MVIMSELHDVDLNLWVVFAQLLDTRSVTGAAANLKKTQSAVSHSLAALRKVFDDPLFVRIGARFEPTPRALALEEPVRAMIREARRSLAPAIDFDPARLQRTFRMLLSDYAQVVLLGKLVDALSREAPGVVLDVSFQSDAGDGVIRQVIEGEVDLAVTPIGAGRSGAVRQQLFTDHNVCALRAGHPALRRFTAARYAELPHVLVSARSPRRDFVDEALEAAGLRRRVVCRVPHFTSAPHIVAGSDAVATIPARVAAAWAKSSAVVFVEPPVKLPRFSMGQLFSELFRHSPEHVWLRKQLVAAAAS
jgi:DNA-binding transcriptional LysR family regulator